MPRRIEIPSSELIPCACGCGQLIPQWVKYGKGRPVQVRFVHGHNGKTHTNTTCDYCGKLYQIPPYLLKRNKHNFCSQDCNRASRRKQELVTCTNCGNSFSLPLNRILKATHFFCNRECKHAYQSTIRDCAACGKQIKVPLSRAKQERVYCDFKCQHIGLALFNRGQTNGNWTGTTRQYRGTNWRPMRRKTLDRDNHMCRLCGKQTGLAVHHLIPIRFFATPEQGNELSNLVTLCRACHSKAEPKKNRNLLNEQLIRENLTLFG